MNLKKLYLILPALIQWSKIDPVSAGALRQHDFLAALQTAPEPEIKLGPQGWTARVVDSLGFGRRNRRADPYKSLTQYKDDLVLRFTISNEAEARAIAGAANQLFLDVWSASNKSMDIRLSPHDLPLVLSFLPESMKNNYTPMMSNILDPIPQSRIEGQKTDTLFFGDYQPWNVILPWMKLLESMFPSYVELLTIGQTHEGRDIHALKVGASEEEDGKRRRADGEKRRTVIITGAAHAREWISVSTVNYLAYSIITGYAKNDKGIDAMVNNIDWIFIPTVNVDGYVYTWEKDRLWRKNRQPTNLAFCQGIDLDRAYDFHFDNSPQSAANPCSEMFPGNYAFQATESKAFVQWAETYTKNNSAKIIGLLDLHSYSQQILYPYSYSCDHPPPDLENLEELGIGLAKAIQVQSGERYEVAAACEGTGFASFPSTTGSGSMLDYFYAKLKVAWTYQIKLRDTGSYGFLLPKENIIPTGEEMLNLVKYFAQFVLDDGGPTFARARKNSPGSDEL
ncbi:hypothetical protein FPQ18DRAFT_295532 [Pyronema domesticum]|uniref:Inactive metallocarboxypeptidase ECM14 n=1 Tax=Pyronema omphalodes (strain CBS 100304) TaxID=1076935 RepID=U4KVT9_PYROM|nr:hypothetical protein FPQ18DRAFT_295532 [Pyronema domesticum]CCX05101.1 Similar to Putative metallocarboxypeptidase ecm14; acc. no. A7EUC0 [Pyronema omphalodes CBS 100304]